MIREHKAYQQFYTSWRDSTTKPGKFEEKFPYELHTGPVPFLAREARENNILVTESYEALYYRILSLRGQDMGKSRGVVVTGQPGVGESPLRDRDLSRWLTGVFDLFRRKNDLPAIHAHAAAIRPPGCGPV